MSNKFTPGPWMVSDLDNENYVINGDGWMGLAEAICNEDGDNMEESKANAYLIAAAPDLLEALQACYKSLCTYGVHPLIDNHVKAAITKATKL